MGNSSGCSSCCSSCCAYFGYKGEDTVGIVRAADHVTEGTYRSILDNEDLGLVQNGQYKSVHPPDNAETPEEIQHRPGKVHICVAGYNQKFLQSVYRAIITTVKDESLTVLQVKLASKTAVDPSTFQGADMIVLVATASQRLMLISDKEESQVGKAYTTAKKIGDVFLILTGHKSSSDLTPSQFYSSSLNQALKNQPELGQLAGTGRFISLGYTHSPEDLQFNQAQEELLGDWIRQNLK